MRHQPWNNWTAPKAWRSLLLLGLSLALGGLVNNRATAQPPNGLVTKDKLHGYVGSLLQATSFTTDTPLGKAGDFSVDYGIGNNGGVWITNVNFLRGACSNDVMSFSIWIYRYDINASSAFWLNSPADGRAFQAHTPYSDDTVYFDTAGCCGATTTRINANIATFGPYEVVGDNTWWNQWHHFVFTKNGPDKQIWIDAQLFLEGFNSNALPVDVDQMWLGQAGGGGSQDSKQHDFAVFGTALTGIEITNLFNGTPPDKLAATNEILAYWPLNDPPVILPVAGTPLGFTLTVNDVGTNVINTNTILLSLAGTAVTPTSVGKSTNGITTIGYTIPNPPFVSGSTQSVALVVKDLGGNSYSATNSFVVPAFATLTPAMILPAGSVNTNLHGFNVLTYLADGNGTGLFGAGNPAPGNGSAAAQGILNGEFGPNVATTNDTDGQLLTPLDVGADGYFAWTNVINFDIAGGTVAVTADDFNPANGYTVFDFPGIPGNTTFNLPNANFAVDVYTALNFPKAGLYTMGVASDDDFLVTEGLNPRDSITGLPLGTFNASGGRGVADTTFQFFVTQPGNYGFRNLYEQGGGGAVLEWFMVSNGVKTLINDVTNAIQAYQWLPTVTAAYIQSVAPLSNSVGNVPNLIQAVIVDGANAVATNSVTLTLDGKSAAFVVSKTNGTTTVTYAGPLLASLSTHTAAVGFKDGANLVSYSWPFTIAQYTTDKVASYWGELQLAAQYTPSGGGHTGNPGDYGIDFTTAGGQVYIPAGGAPFLNAAASNDVMTMSIWIKRYDISASSSVIWADSPSSNNGQRGWNAHVPWSDDTIYYDTAGCCNPDTRLAANIDTFTNYLTGVGYNTNGALAWWTTNWHHFVFVKNTTFKQIWIDGLPFIDNGNATLPATPLPTDFTDLTLGAYGPGNGGSIGNPGGNMHGLIDDYSVYATALGTNEIASLFKGTSPSALAATNQLVAYWNFDDAPVVAAGPAISVGVVGGKVTITYGGTLQSSATVNGTYTTVAGATSPYTVPTPLSAETFYRAKQ